MRALALTLTLAAAAVLLTGEGAARPGGRDPYSLFAGCFAVSASEQAKIDRWETVVKVLPERDGYIAAAGVRRIGTDGARLVEWARQIEQLKQSPFIVNIGRFSDPPQASDLEDLKIDVGDIDALKNCRVSNCDVKLTAAEIARVQRAVTSAGREWKTPAESAFRASMIDRMQAYVEAGQEALGQYADGHSPQPLATAFTALVGQASCLADGMPDLTRHLTGRSPVVSHLESFYYWSVDKFGGRPIFSATEVVIAPNGIGPAEAVVAGKQLFATHYANASLNIVAIVSASPAGPHTLVIMNRTDLDLIHGPFAAITRSIAERKLRNQLGELMEKIAKRLEAGPPERK